MEKKRRWNRKGNFFMESAPFSIIFWCWILCCYPENYRIFEIILYTKKPKQILPRFLFSICRLALKDLDTSVQFPQPLCTCRRGFHLANSAKRSQGGSILHVQNRCVCVVKNNRLTSRDCQQYHSDSSSRSGLYLCLASLSCQQGQITCVQLLTNLSPGKKDLKKGLCQN